MFGNLSAIGILKYINCIVKNGEPAVHQAIFKETKN
jgi:hypothetical protein